MVEKGEERDDGGLLQIRRAFAEGGFERGMGRTLGIVGVEAAFGRVVLTGNPTPDHYNPLGTVHGGYVATILDSAIGLAVHTSLPAGVGYSTTDLKISYLRALTAKSGPLRGEGSLLHAGRRVAFGEAKLFDAEGRMCAHATATCLVLAPRPEAV